MQSLAVGGYTAAVVAAQLQASGAEDWSYDHLGPDGRYLKDLTPFVETTVAPQVQHDSTAAVKRHLTIGLRGDCGVAPLQDLIRPHYRLQMPDAGWADWALGTFVMMLPAKTITSGATWWKCVLPDLSQLLVDAGLSQPVTVAAGSTVGTALQGLLAIANQASLSPLQVVLTSTPDAILPQSLGWSLGDSPLKAINELLTGSAWQTAWLDESAPLPLLRSAAIPDFNTVAASYSFDATAPSTNVLEGIQEAADPSKIFNEVWVVGEDPRTKTPAVGHYLNTNPLSPYSVQNWHRKTAPTIRDSHIPDAASATARARAEVQAAARVGATLTVDSFAWPASEDRDVYQATYSTADEGLRTDLFLETRWTHTCRAGAPTRHELERLVPA